MNQYPSCVVHLKIVFDETLHLQPELPAPLSTDDMVNQPARSLASPQAEPLISRSTDSTNVSFILNRQPSTANIEKPGFRQAAQFKGTFQFKDVPIDPRTVRAIGFEVHLGTVSPSDFGEGVHGTRANGRRLTTLRTVEANGAPRLDTLQLVGVADDWEIEESESGGTVTISGRDLRGILLDSPVNPKLLDRLDTTLPIHRVIGQIMETHPLVQMFNLRVRADQWPSNQVVPALPASIVPRHRRRASGRGGGRASTGSNSAQMNYWDLITRLCFVVGAVPYFVGYELLIRPVISIFDQQNAGFNPSISTPFLPDQVRDVGGFEFGIRRMVFGSDIATLKVKRKFTGHSKPRVIRCISSNLSTTSRSESVVVEARWPPSSHDRRTTAARRTTVAPSARIAHEEIVNVPVPGVRDQARLQQIARSLFENIGRQEIEGDCDTSKLTSFGGTNADPDLLRLNPGDGVEFYMTARGSHSAIANTIVDHNTVSTAEAIRQTTARIGDENLARVIVATARGEIAEVPKFFRVSSVKYDVGETEVTVNFSFQNYFVARNDLSGTVQPAPSTTDAIVATPGRARAHAARASRPTANPTRRTTLPNEPTTRTEVVTTGRYGGTPVALSREEINAIVRNARRR